MITKEQIKKEYFATLVKGVHDVAAGDIVLLAIISKDLYKKYQYEITTDEFNDIGDELEEEGYFRWNENGQLALTADGLNHFQNQQKS